jgi:hypothetical protein
MQKYNQINFSLLPSSNFFKIIYRYLYRKVIDFDTLEPQIDFDGLNHDLFIKCYEKYNVQANMKNFHVKNISKKEYNKARAQKSLLVFLLHFPDFYIYLKNVNADATVSIQNAEKILGARVSIDNFIQIKRVIDEQNRLRWSREKTNQESQGGVSILGTISETILNMAMSQIIDEKNFFKTTMSEIQSYGDFVLMCLPNNLWLSVKSNFARERLLASGFSTDIIGVGFFTDSKEFTSQAKIRNFLKVGFLAMYIPDVPITQEQIDNNTSTYDEVIAYYEEHDIALPTNINQTPFIRKLSDIKNDLKALLDIKDISKRTTVFF